MISVKNIVLYLIRKNFEEVTKSHPFGMGPAVGAILLS
jgi:hypothetical protein